MSTTLENKPAFLSQSADFGESDCWLCVQCLAAYNQGHHHFYWLDLEELNTDSLEEFEKDLNKAIKFVIDTSPAMGSEEHFYTDHCGIDSIYDEYMSPETLFEYLEGLKQAKADGYSHELWETYLSEYDPSDRSYDNFRDMYYGCYDSGEEFAESICKECGYIPNDLPSWVEIDWESTWDNLSQDYTLIDADGESHIFTN